MGASGADGSSTTMGGDKKNVSCEGSVQDGIYPLATAGKLEKSHAVRTRSRLTAPVLAESRSWNIFSAVWRRVSENPPALKK